MMDDEARFETFLARFVPGIAALGRAAVKRLRVRLPGCDALVYDDYNALAVGFSPDGTTAGIVVSIALYPRSVRLYLLEGAALADPEGLLKGAGGTARHLVLGSANDLDLPAIRALIDEAELRAGLAGVAQRMGALVVKAVSDKPKPRRPG